MGMLAGHDRQDGMTHDRLWDDLVDRAKAVRLEDELARRHHTKLTGRGPWRAGPCPYCNGTDRFVVHIRRQTWFCRKCNRNGDIIELIKHLDGLDFKGAVELLAGDSISRPIRHVTPADDDDDVKEAHRNFQRALKLWDESRDPRGTIVERYLNGRELELPDDVAGNVIRHFPDCPFFKERHPAMIALVRDIESDVKIAIQRTAISADAKAIKRKDKDGREKTFRLSLGSTSGGAIKIDPDEHVEYGILIGEGVETCLAARQIGLSPVWSLCGTSGLSNFQVIDFIDGLTILAEAGEPSTNAVQACFDRWTLAGRDVRVLKSTIGSDINDAIRRVA
jgi:hypothetical protein